MLSGIGMCACTSSPPAATQAPKAAKGTQYYVSLGDSYAAGFQPTGRNSVGSTTTNGFAYQLPGLAAARGYHLTTVNFGCDGATTTSILYSRGCSGLGPGAPTYPDQSQATAAEAFLTEHEENIGLITVSIGGNDLIQACFSSTDPVGCVRTAVTSINTNLPVLLSTLRADVGPDVPIVGITYPDFVLGDYLSTNASIRALVPLSVSNFMDIFNPALQKLYAAAGATFVDVTSGTGAYIPLSQTINLPPYGTIPVAVARICQLTYYCIYGDVHPTTAGYTQIASLISDALPER
jgi:lysophospholipase L1-like esterase